MERNGVKFGIQSYLVTSVTYSYLDTMLDIIVTVSDMYLASDQAEC